MSPLLFADKINWTLLLATKDQGITWLQHSCLSDLDFVDDIASLADNTLNIQDLVDSINDHAGMVGLSINAKNTKNILIGDCQPCTYVLSLLTSRKLKMLESSYILEVPSTTKVIWIMKSTAEFEKH